MKVIIVGGVAGGASAAARLRRLDEKAEITIYERSGYISYANCGLPYYIGDVISDQGELTLQTPESFYKRFHIQAKVHHEVMEIEPEKKMVTVCDLQTGKVWREKYDKLILSPGAKAIKPNIPGIDMENIFTLRTVEDTLDIDNYVKAKNVKSAVVVGGGFIGLEAAENLKHIRINVTIVEAAHQVLSILDEDMACQIHALLRENDIELLLGSGIAAFEKAEGGDQVISILANGRRIYADMVVLAIGVTPDTVLAQKAGIKTGLKGSIVVNEKMETSIPDIYAIGDAIEMTHYITGKKALISLAGPANKQGRIVADNISGGESIYKGTQGSSVIKLFDMTAAATGITERVAKMAGISYGKVILSPASHASYYPGGKIMTIKAIFDQETNRILGAQIVGYEGVDKRIDVIATAIRAGMRINELAELELAYAPPFSSAKDPVNMIGFIAENLITEKVKQFYYEDLGGLFNRKDVFLLDARTPQEYARGHVEGFLNIPVDELRGRIMEIPNEKSVYVMCQSGLRSYIACRILSNLGYECYNFAGGYRFFSMVEKENLANPNSYTCGMEK